jgi:hypothetical protein
MSKNEVSSNKAPILTVGFLTPETLCRFENACKNFFHSKKIPVDEQVSSVAGNMYAVLILDWYWTDDMRINTLSFNNFIKEMKSKWLKDGWEQDIRHRVLGTKQKGPEFWS